MGRFFADASTEPAGLELGGGSEGRTSPPGRVNFDGAGNLDISSGEQPNERRQIEKSTTK